MSTERVLASFADLMKAVSELTNELETAKEQAADAEARWKRLEKNSDGLYNSYMEERKVRIDLELDKEELLDLLDRTADCLDTCDLKEEVHAFFEKMNYTSKVSK